MEETPMPPEDAEHIAAYTRFFTDLDPKGRKMERFRLHNVREYGYCMNTADALLLIHKDLHKQNKLLEDQVREAGNICYALQNWAYREGYI